MAINKGQIIGDVMLMLGNSRDYNEPSSEEYIIAGRLFDKALNDMFYNKKLLFNAATVKLNYAQKDRNHAGEYKYLLPYGMINIISPSDIRMEGEFIYSRAKDLYVKYCRKIPLNEIPEYITPLFQYRLAIEMAMTFKQYEHKLQLFAATHTKLLGDIQMNEIDNIDGPTGLVRRYYMDRTYR